MKDNETKEKFIELRAKGYSYDKIAKELSVSKPTLIDWSRDFENEIQNLKAIEVEALQEKYYLTKKAKIEFYGNKVKEIVKELEERDLKGVSTKDLLKLLLRYQEKLEKDYEPIKFKREVGVSDILSLSETEEWSV